MVEALGPPLDLMLEPYAEAEDIPALVDRFRAMYPGIAVAPTLALPGTHDAIAAVRASGGTVVVVTGKFTPNALLHTEALSLDVDHVVGEVWGVGKAEVLREHGCGVYVGDHVHDVEGALAAGATSVSVLTGGCTEAELREAGTHHVLRDLTEFPGWWSGHLATGATAFAPGP
jgi:phosphoglycolate phosphatase